MDAPTRTYGGLSAEQRSSRRRAALLDAALDQLADGGVNSVTKSAVCSRAGLNDRYFYQHFADRDALLATLIAETAERGIATAVAAMADAGGSVAAQLYSAGDAALTFLTSDPRLKALVVGPHNDVSHRARVSAQHSIANAMAAVVRGFTDTPVAGIEVEMVSYTVVSGLVELAAAWLRGEFMVSQDQLRDLIGAMLLAGTTMPGLVSGTDPADG